MHTGTVALANGLLQRSQVEKLQSETRLIKAQTSHHMYLSLACTLCLGCVFWHGSELRVNVDTDFVELPQDLVDTLLDGVLVGAEVHFRVLWSLVWRIDACETFDLSSAGLLIQTLGITILDGGKRRIDEDLHERQRSIDMNLSSILTVLGIWRDQASDGDCSCLGEKPARLCNTSDIFLAILLTEAKISVKTETQIVSIKPINEVSLGLNLHQGFLQTHTDGALTTSRKSGHPKCDALVADGRPSCLSWDTGVKTHISALPCICGGQLLREDLLSHQHKQDGRKATQLHG